MAERPNGRADVRGVAYGGRPGVRAAQATIEQSAIVACFYFIFTVSILPWAK